MARKPFTPKPASAPEKSLDEQLAQSAIAEAESIEEQVELTINGKPIPPEFAHAVVYSMTDQGKAEAQATDALTRPSGAQVLSGPWEKSLQRKADAEVWDGFDPLREAVDAVRQPGMDYRFISDRVLNRRGRRGWEPVTGKDGKPVKVAGMSLGTMPVESAERRNAHYQRVGNDQLETAAQEYELQQSKAIREAKVRGMAPLRVGEEVVDNHAHPGMVTPVGVQTVRGGVAAE